MLVGVTGGCVFVVESIGNDGVGAEGIHSSDVANRGQCGQTIYHINRLVMKNTKFTERHA